MKKRAKIREIATIIVLLVLTVIMGGCTDISNAVPESDIQWNFYNDRADSFILAMADGDFDAAVAMFDRAMTRAMNVSTLNDFWNEVCQRAGAFTALYETENLIADGYYLCHVTSRHENAGVTIRVVFNKEGLVAGLFIVDYPDIDYEDTHEATQREGFTDYPVVIGEGTQYPLRGLLSMPDNAERVPAVVIVHGSGPQDMDATMFTNKPYRDIAEYLAQNGIAVIRYNKRTYSYGAQFDGSSTVWDETIEDAILASEILKSDLRIDENNVYVIGHSLGGMLAPRIHTQGGDFAGLILLAGSPRFLLDLSKDQNIAYINETMEGEERETALTQIAQSWDAQIEALVNLPDDVAANTPVEAGMSALYLKDLFFNPASEYIENISVPFLVLQGSNDLQVLADVDFVLYQELLSGRSNATFRLYDGLNHLFMHGTGASIVNLMDEYAIEGKVDDRVLSDIVEWIMANR